MEAAIVERLRRPTAIQLHPTLLNAPLIYTEAGRRALAGIYQGYIDIAANAALPIFLCTPTWRANQSRVADAKASQTINQDAAGFIQELRRSQGSSAGQIKIGGMIGCKNDCYRPDEGLSVSEAQQFHTWQIVQLVQGGVDFLIAETLPNVQEALGIANAMAMTQTPYIISFVISRAGQVMDGASLNAAVALIDSNTRHKPLGYMVNCAYPTFLCPGRQPADLFNRLIGFQANASSLDHCDLDDSSQLKADELSEWGDLMLQLNQGYGVKILGGCCGTGNEHLQALVSGGQASGPRQRKSSIVK